MKRILFIAPDSFPIKGAESIVNIKLLKALSKSPDILIDLISKKDKTQFYPSDKLEDLGISLSSISIIEVDNRVTIHTILQHIVSFFMFGIAFKGSHWAVKATHKAAVMAKQNHYDYVVTKNRAAPLVGYYLKKHFGLKWVMTCNDPMPEEMYPEPYGHGIYGRKSFSTKVIIGKITKYVDKIIFPNNRLRDYVLQYIPIQIKDTIIIPHVVNCSVKNVESISGRLQLIHSGNLSLPRNPYTFFSALRHFIDMHPDFDFSVSLLGVGNKKICEDISKFKLQEIVQLLPPVSYVNSLEILKDYDVAVIIEANCKEGIFLPTKVSDFMQEGKKIFAISPQNGVLHDLFIKGKISYFADVSSEESIHNELEKIYEDYLSGKLRDEKTALCEEYSEESIINQYLSI